MERGAHPRLPRIGRSTAACTRCRSQKVKCSGEKPKCRPCQQAKHAVECIYPTRDRKISVSESFVRALQAENKALSIEVSRGSGCNTPTATPSINKQDSLPSTSWDTFSNTSEGQAENDVCVVADEISIQPQYIGEAACTTFVRRLQQHINGYPLPPSPSPSRYYKHPGLSVLSASDFRLPVRIEAQLLVRTVVRFIGPDYHLLPRKSLPEKMIATYQMPVYDDPIWICRLFVIFALGELYAHRAHSKKSRAVPGTIYFLKAMTILQEIHEEPSISYIETVLLISFYSLALNRKNTAYTYSGLALRLSLTLGLHRNIPQDRIVSPRDREHRIRLFWTVYVMDREHSTQTGLPIMIQDKDIDVPLPSNEGLSESDKEDFHDPIHLIALIKLSRIAGDIINEIYSIPQPNRVNRFVLRVQRILANLRSWNDTLPRELQFNRQATPMYSSRSIASLHLNFSQCVILTTRPIFFHFFQCRLRILSNNGTNPGRPLSQMTEALAEACVQAARTLGAILAELWVDGSLAIFGFYDSLALFSSTTILMMATTLRPNDTDDDAVRTALCLLRAMRDDGNLSASDHYEQLRKLKTDLDRVRKQAVGDMVEEAQSGSLDSMQPVQAGISFATDRAGSSSNANNSTLITEEIMSGVPINLDSAAALDDPFLQGFLAQHQPTTDSWQETTGLFGDGVNSKWNFDWEDANLFDIY